MRSLGYYEQRSKLEFQFAVRFLIANVLYVFAICLLAQLTPFGVWTRSQDPEVAAGLIFGIPAIMTVIAFALHIRRLAKLRSSA
jgi:hypothetical protein